LLNNNLFSQDCNDPVCIEILKGLNEKNKLIDEKGELQQKVQNLESDLSKINKELEHLRKFGKSNSDKAKRLQKDYNQKSEFINSIQSQLNSTLRKLTKSERTIRNLMKENREVVHQYDFLEKEYKVLEQKYLEFKARAKSYQTDADLLAFDQTYIRSVEVGVQSNNKVIFHKVYEGEKMTSSNPKLFGKKIDALQISEGKLIIRTEANEHDKKIEGYMLIYLDNYLLETRRKSILQEESVLYSNYESYDFASTVITLKDKIDPNAVVRVGFVDKKTYEENKKYFDTFWEAQNRNLFSITTIEPKHSEFTQAPILEHKIFVKEYMTIFDKNIQIEIIDNKEVDNDIINVYFNEKILNSKVTLPAEGNPIISTLILNQGDNYIYTEALDEGTKQGGCTAKIIIKQDSNIIKVIDLQAQINSKTKEAILIKVR
jgi:hypothetical protein